MLHLHRQTLRAYPVNRIASHRSRVMLPRDLLGLDERRITRLPTFATGRYGRCKKKGGAAIRVNVEPMRAGLLSVPSHPFMSPSFFFHL